MPKELKELIDIESWKKIQDKFSEAIGQPVYTVDMEGEIVYKSGDFPFYCQIVHSKDTKSKCHLIRKEMFEKLKKSEEPLLIYYCNFGMLNIMVPIKVDDEQVGAVVCSSIVKKTRNVPLCRRVGQELGVESIELLDAVKEIKVRSTSEVDKFATLLLTLSRAIPSVMHEKRASEKKLSELEIIQEITNLLNSTFDLEKIFKSIITFVYESGIGDASDVLIFENDGNKRYLLNKVDIPRHYLNFEDRIVEEVQRDEKFVFVPMIKSDERFQSQSQLNIYSTMVSIPRKIKEKIIGALNIYSNSIDKLKENTNFLSIIANQSAMAIQNARQYSKIRQLAITDKLTNLYNRRYFMELLKNEIERSKRFKKPLSIAILDIDNFRNYNNAHGHLVGDKLLAEFSTILKKSIRNIDTAGRYGGEEFVVLLPESNPQDASVVGERMRKAVEEAYFEGEEEQPLGRVTVSIGIATCLNNSLDHSELIKEADKALYKAKETGKNKVVSTIVVDRNLGVVEK
ncbi:diguanylate cyclase [Candidatus Woesearchaeota archaeon]|nr:diguanylate cyclase [Candidatus Woesearchaeota archaeon]